MKYWMSWMHINRVIQYFMKGLKYFTHILDVLLVKYFCACSENRFLNGNYYAPFLRGKMSL